MEMNFFVIPITWNYSIEISDIQVIIYTVCINCRCSVSTCFLNSKLVVTAQEHGLIPHVTSHSGSLYTYGTHGVISQRQVKVEPPRK